MDGIHYTVDSYKVIGQRFADAIATIQSGRSAVERNSQANPNGESPAPESAQ